MTRIILVEPLETVREALRLLLVANQFEVVAQAATGPEALTLINRIVQFRKGVSHLFRANIQLKPFNHSRVVWFGFRERRNFCG